MSQPEKVEDPPGAVQWEQLLSLGAAALAVTFYIGHEVARLALYNRYRFSGSPVAIFTYDELLMRGVDTVLNFVAPRVVLLAIAAYLLHARAPQRLRSILSWALSVLVALFALATPHETLQVVPQFLIAEHDDLLSKLFTFACAFAILEYRAGNYLSQLPQRLVSILLVGGVAFTVWLFPFLAVASTTNPPSVTVVLNDRTAMAGELLSQRDGMLVIGIPAARSCRVIPVSAIAQYTIP